MKTERARDVRVRRMTAADVATVVDIEAEAFTTPWHVETFQGLLERDGMELLVLESREGELLGYAVLWCILDQGELANIAIRPEYRGRGLGARLLEEVVAVCRDRGVRSLYLEVRASNQAAVDLYQGFGFRQVGRRRGYYQNPREDARVMELVLA